LNTVSISIRNRWSAISVTRSLKPFCSAVFYTLPKVSPIIAISMFMKTTRIKKVATMNMHIDEF